MRFAGFLIVAILVVATRAVHYEWGAIVLPIMVIIIVLLPAKYDPAIQFKSKQMEDSES